MEGITQILTGLFIPLLLLAAGLFYAVRLRFFPLIHLPHILRALTQKRSESGISPFRSLTLALAGTLGVGNIVGVTSAIALGGPGSVFWMWMSAFAVMLLKYAEVFLGMKYRQKKKGAWQGGTPYYIKEGLTKRGHPRMGILFATLFALLCLLDSFTTGCAIQSSAIAGAMLGVTGFSPLLCGLITAVLCTAVLISGKHTLFRATELLVPFMCGGYILLSLACMLREPQHILPTLSAIFKSAFSGQSAAGGIFGFLLSRSLRFGTMRGLLSNEAGCGTSPFAHAAAESASPVEQGFFGIFEVFVDTILLCSMTAFVVIPVAPPLLSDDLSPIMMAICAYSRSFSGSFAHAVELFLAISVLLFGFATFLCWAHYGRECLIFLGVGKKGQILYFLLFAVVIILGALGTPQVIWNLSDLIIAAMLTLHVPLLCLFSHEVRSDTLPYFGISTKRTKRVGKFTKYS